MAKVNRTLTLNAHGAVPGILNYSRSSAATKINSIGHVETVASGLIRLDYDPSNMSLLGWLLEESSSNTCLQSQTFETTWTTPDLGNVSANQTKSPDGTNNADALIASSSATGMVAVKQQGFTFNNGSHYTVSVWAKKKDLDFLEISNKDDGAAGMTFAQTFNLSTGATGASGGTVFASRMRAFPNDWYRCEVTFEATGASATDIYLKARSDNAVSTTFAATNQQGIYIWGAQIEGKKYATSYIPTTTAIVVRAADVAYIDGTEGKWNWDVGVSLLIDATPLNTSDVVSPIYHYQDADNSDYITHLSDGKLAIVNAGSGQLDSNPFDAGSVFNQTRLTNFRSMMSIGGGRMHAAQNGSLSQNLPDTSVVLPANGPASSYTVKFFHGTGLTSGSGWLKQFRIYPTNLGDLDIQNHSFRSNQDAQSLQLQAVQVLDGTISEQKLGNNAVTNAKVADNAITAAEVLDGSLTGANLGAGAVTATQIAAGTITGTQIANNAITSAHLGLDVIVAEDIAANAITVSELQDNAVVKAKISDNSVDIAKLDVTDSGNAGDVLKTNGSGALGFTNPSSQAVGGDLTGTVGNAQIAANTVGVAELNVSEGTNGQYLTTNGAGALSFTTDSTNVGAASVGGDLTGTVANAQIAGGAIGTPEIANDAVDADKLAPNAVVSGSIVAGNVIEASLANDAVTADKLADHASTDSSRAVGTNHIKDDAVTGDKIAAATITASNIVAGTLTGSNLGTGTITSANIQDGSIDTADLADAAIDDQKLASHASTDSSRAVGTNHIKDSAITAGKIGTGAIIANKIGALQVGNAAMATNAITTAKIADNQVTIAKLAVTDGTSGQVLTTDGNGVLSFTNDSTNVGGTAVGGDVTGTVSNITIPAGAITSAMIGTDVIVAEDLANNSITVAELSDNAVTRAKIIADAIDGTKIADDAIESEHIANGSVDAAHLAANSVTAGQIAVNSVDGTKIALGSDAAGDVMYYNGTDYVRLAKGSAGEVLTINSGATAPEWSADSTNVGGTAVGGDLTGTVSNAQIGANKVGTAELNLSEGSAGDVLKTDGAGTISYTDPAAQAVGGHVTGTVGNITIPANAITSSMIAAGAIVAQDIAINSVDGTHIALGSDVAGDTMYYDGTNYVRLAKGTAGQVLTMNSGATAPEWSADSTDVGGTAVGGDVTGTVSNITIPNNTITTAMIAADVIVAEDIANNAITVAELQDNAVATAKILDNAVTGAKIAMGSDAAGDTMYYNGTDYVRLAKGTAGQILTMNSGATAPEWTTDSGGYSQSNTNNTSLGGMLGGTIANASINAGVVTPTMLSATGTASSSTFLRGDGTWSTVTVTETDPTAVTMAIALG